MLEKVHENKNILTIEFKKKMHEVKSKIDEDFKKVDSKMEQKNKLI